MKKICLTAFVLGLLPLISVPMAHAVIEPPTGSTSYDAGVIDQKNLMFLKEFEQKTRQENAHVNKDDIIMDKKVYDEIEKLPNAQLRFVLNAVKFTGNTVFTEDELLAIVCDSIETEISLDDLLKFAEEITKRYQQLGYISSFAYVPPQRIEEGAVEVMIVEGKYANVSLEGNKWARNRYINTNFIKDKNLVQDNLLNIRDVQTSLEELNAQGYMKGSITLQDSEQGAEYTDVIYNVKDRFPFNLQLRVDNQGQSMVGLNRFVIFTGMYNLTGFGDQLVSTTTLARHSFGQGVFYSVPLAKNETKMNLGYSYSGTRLGDLYDGALRDVQGKSHNAFVGFSRRLIRTENYKMYGDISLDVRNTKTVADNYDGDLYGYNTRAIRVNFSNIKDDFYGKWFANVGTSVGVPFFDASDNKYWESQGAPEPKNKMLPSNNFFKVNANLTRVQVLPWRSLAILQANTQLANRALWSAEKMQLGGISTVRGYEESSLMGDSGVSASLELRTPVPFLRMIMPEKLKFIDDSIRLAAFYDFGLAANRFNTLPFGTTTDKDKVYISSIGFGTVLRLTKYLSGNVYMGIPIGQSYGEDTRSKARVHFTITSNIL